MKRDTQSDTQGNQTTKLTVAWSQNRGRSHRILKLLRVLSDAHASGGLTDGLRLKWQRLTSSVSKLSADCGFLIRLSSLLSRLSSLLSAPSMVPAQPVRFSPTPSKNSPKIRGEGGKQYSLEIKQPVIWIYTNVPRAAPAGSRTDGRTSLSYVDLQLRNKVRLGRWIIYPGTLSSKLARQCVTSKSDSSRTIQVRNADGGAPHFPGEHRVPDPR